MAGPAEQATGASPVQKGVGNTGAPDAPGAAPDAALEEELFIEHLLKQREGSRLLSRQASRRDSTSRTSSSRQPSRHSSARRIRSSSQPTSRPSSGVGRASFRTHAGLVGFMAPQPVPVAVPENAYAAEYSMTRLSATAEASDGAAAAWSQEGRARSPSRLRFSSHESVSDEPWEPRPPRISNPMAAGSRASSFHSPASSRPVSRVGGGRPSSASVLGRLLSLGRGGMSVAPLPPPSQEEAIAAAREGREQVLSEWLHHNLEQINDPVDDGYTLLHLAAEEGHVAAVQVLLSLGAAMDTMDEDCQTPLHLAAAGGHLAVVQALAPPRLNCVEILQEDKYQMTPWHLAIESGNLDLVSYMLSAFPQSIKMRQRSGTALFMARRSNHNEIVKLLESPVASAPSAATPADAVPSSDEIDDASPLPAANNVQEAARRWEQAHHGPAAPPAESREDGREVRFTPEAIQRAEAGGSCGGAGGAGGGTLLSGGIDNEQARAEGAAAHEDEVAAGSATDQGEGQARAAAGGAPAGCACCIM